MSQIGVVTLGRPGWPRLALFDDLSRYWTGAEWSADVTAARLFADEQATAAEYERVVGLVRQGQPVKEYTARVTVRVRGNQQYDLGRLARYLAAACKLHLDQDRDEQAPDAAVTVQIDWGGLAELDGGKPGGQ